jgi:hypothetical protein
VPSSNPPRLVDFEARITHLMFNVHNLNVLGVPKLAKPDLALNTGDNVYVNGAEGSYRADSTHYRRNERYWTGDSQ